MREVAIQLDEAETARIVVDEGRGLQRFPVRHRPPQPFAAAIENSQSTGVVNRRAGVVRPPAIDGAGEKRRGHRRDAETVHGDAREQRAFGVHDGRVAGPQREPIGARQAVRIQQRVEDDRALRQRRPLDPHLPEERNFLALGIGDLERQPPRPRAEGHAARDGPVEARALEHGHRLGLAAGRIHQQLEAGKSHIGKPRRRFQRAEVKVLWMVGQRARDSVRDNVDFHRRRVNKAAMERRDHKAKIVVGPQLAAGAVLDRGVLLARQIGEGLGQLRVRRLERPGRQRAGGVGDLRRLEGRRRGWGNGRRGWPLRQNSPRRRRQSGHAQHQHIATLQHRSSGLAGESVITDGLGASYTLNVWEWEGRRGAMAGIFTPC